MNKILLIALREFVATVFSKAFVIGLLVVPALIALGFVIMPRLFNSDFSVAGEVTVIDPTGQVAREMRAALTEGTDEARRADAIRAARAGTADGLVLEALGAAPKLTLIERPPGADIEREKTWLRAEETETPRLALAVIHSNAIEPRAGETDFGSYDLYVPPGQDQRAEIAVHQSLREAIISARISAQGLDRAAINELVTVPRVQSVTVTEDDERQTVGGFNFILPLAFMVLLFMGVMGSGQGLLTTTIEEKSSRVVEVLLSAVSPMQLMAGKLLGHMGISLLAMSLYIGLGLLALTSFSLLGLLEPVLIFYLFVFFVISFFTNGSLMMAVGAAVNDMREAQSLMMPFMLTMMMPWFFWVPISRDPSSTLSIVVSLVPPVSSFGMLLRLASTEPPPLWQVWLSIGIGIAGVVCAVWIAAKVFRIGLLMFGKPPDFATLVRWMRAA
ncbi:MAG TPA: ABC transporter permease [Gammaproteobacteria bacterium]|nr:ABC transporter permease [Gammaproteobacteria bacterium]